MNDEVVYHPDGSIGFRTIAATVTYAPDEARRRFGTRPPMSPIERRDVAEEDRLRRMYPSNFGEKPERPDPLTPEERSYYERAYPSMRTSKPHRA